MVTPPPHIWFIGVFFQTLNPFLSGCCPSYRGFRRGLQGRIHRGTRGNGRGPRRRALPAIWNVSSSSVGVCGTKDWIITSFWLEKSKRTTVNWVCVLLISRFKYLIRANVIMILYSSRGSPFEKNPLFEGPPLYNPRVAQWHRGV